LKSKVEAAPKKTCDRYSFDSFVLDDVTRFVQVCETFRTGRGSIQKMFLYSGLVLVTKRYFAVPVLIFGTLPIAQAQIERAIPARADRSADAPYPDRDSTLGFDDCADARNAFLPECAATLAEPSGPSRYNSDPFDTNPRVGRSTTGRSFGRADEFNPDTASAAERPLSRQKEPPTEFQRYVKSATGQMLPIFGASLFERVPSTFAPVERMPMAPNYVLGPGDEVQVRVWGQINFTQRLVVDRNGSVYLPEAGPVNVAGLTFNQLDGAFRSAIGRIYHNFDLNVNLGQLRTVQILVVGQALRPGSYTVSSLSTLVNALFASGGPSPRGSLRHIQLKRAGTLVSELDLYDLLLSGDKSKDVPILPGDILFIPAVGPQVAVMGSVDNPAIYELADSATASGTAQEHSNLGKILASAGGLSPLAANQHAIIERIEAGAALKTSEVPLDGTGLAEPLRNGDIVRVQNVVARFNNAVTLRGNVADARRYAWHAGMRVSDLIPNKESLLTRDYWRERNRLGVADQPVDELARDSNSPLPLYAANLTGPTTSANPVSLPARPSSREQAQGTRDDRSLASAQSSVQGATIRKFDVRNQVQQPAPDINWDYAVVERLDSATLMTKLIPFNLAAAVIDRNPEQNPLLERGDVVTILSKADVAVPLEHRTKYVHIEGEVGSAGVYSVTPGETLRTLLQRAGGITREAYLYGLQFTRESTQREQQQRFSEFLDSLEVQINQSSSNLSGRVLAADQAAVAQSTLTSQRALVQKLRETPPTGRIVLDLEPSMRTIANLPDLSLEDGDRIYIPSRPSTVNVIGTVPNQASFVYKEDARLGDYLRQAGGVARFGDRSHMFVIRADGSVVSDHSNATLFGRHVESTPMFPGDTLIVPTFVNKVTFLRGLTDWSQVVSNFALGAAAVNLLR
jgi:polysaccharide biosynthesis/export protein